MRTKLTRFAFNKLVRDKLLSPELYDPRIVMHTRILEQTEFIVELKKKLVEEADEIVAASLKEELIEEIADLQEIISTLMHSCSITDTMIRNAREKKRNERGGFEKRLFVSYADIPKDAAAYDYCIKKPNKYPIITRND